MYAIKSAHDKEIFDITFNSIGTLIASASNDHSVKVTISILLSFISSGTESLLHNLAIY